jgi:high affinity Mn2+ porin
MRNAYLKRSVPALFFCLAICVYAQNPPVDGNIGEAGSLSLPDRLWLSGQANFITQYNPFFPAKYSGPNSFGPAAQKATSRVLTLYTGLRLTNNTEILFDLESAGGTGLSNALGMAGFTNLDVVRNPTLGSTPYVGRVMLHQVIPLSSQYDDAVRGPIGLASKLPVRRLELRFGKLSTADFFDVNGVGSDSHLQFLNWAADNNAAFDYAADTRGYTYGFLAEFYDRNYVLRFGEMLMPTVANGLQLDWNIARTRGQNAELELHPSLFQNHASTIRLLSFTNVANMGSYREAIQAYRSGLVQTPDITASRRQGRLKYGFGLNLEQTLREGWRAYGRFGWSDGKNESFAYTEVDQSISIGSDLRGLKWRRSEDKVGTAVLLDAISEDHRTYLALGGLGFLLGDGALNYGREKIWESYYNLHIWRGIYVGGDVQRVWNPGYNRDRGPVSVFSLRMHVEDAANFGISH